MSPTQRDALTLRDVHDPDYQETAERLPLPEGTVKSRSTEDERRSEEHGDVHYETAPERPVGYAGRGQGMVFTFERVGRIPGLPAVAAAAAIVVVAGIAATILTIVGVVGCGARLLRALGLVTARRAPASPRGEIIEGVVVNRSSVVVNRSSAGLLER